MTGELSPKDELPKLAVWIKIEDGKLTIANQEVEDFEFELDEGKVLDVIQLDVWISNLLFTISQQAEKKPKIEIPKKKFLLP